MMLQFTCVCLLSTLALAASPASGQCDPFILGSVATPRSGVGVAVSGNVAYVCGDFFSGGLQVIDVSNPAIPVILGSVDTPGQAWGVVISGSIAYVADGEVGTGLQVIDVSDPANPVIVGSVITPGVASGVAISGTVAYVADGSFGLQVIDVSNPAAPVILGSVDTPLIANGVVISGTVAYVADGDFFGMLGGLQVIDVSDPANPVIVGSVDMPGYARGVAISGTVAYVADGSFGLQVIDVSNPTNPFILGSVDTPGTANRVAISGNVAYVADGSSGLQVIDILRCNFGACCVDGVCLDLTTEANCLTLGGTFFGVGSTCATSDCTNNSCGGAIPIALGDTLFSTIGATTDGPLHPGCDGSDGTLFTNDIWFKYTADANGDLTVSTCGQALFNTIIAAYSGECNSLNLLTCDDQGCGNQSIMTIPVSVGQTYLLRVGGWNNNTGTGTLSLTMSSCAADINSDTNVNVTDLLALLAAWGACP